MRLKKKTQGGGIRKFFIFTLLILIIACGVYITLVYFEKSPPQITLAGVSEYVGENGTISFTVADKGSGLKNVKLSIQQGEKEYDLVEKSFTRMGYSAQMGPSSFTEDIGFTLSKSALSDGEAEIVATASDYSVRGFFSGNHSQLKKNIIIDTQPPKIRIMHSERYIRSGGSGIVLYQLDAPAANHGADFAGYFHKGYPLESGDNNVFIAYLAVPYDASEITGSRIVATDAAGNTSSQSFSPVFKKTQERRDQINVGDNFLLEKIPEFEVHYPDMQGSLQDKYLYANSVVRKENNDTIFKLCRNPVGERLWKGKFLRMAGANRAGYADYRTYFYKGKEIDRQVHLGMDIASTSQAEVKAANNGKVVYGDYLGIYGNMVLLDHGQGVFSLYSHMSAIRVAVGDTITSGTVIGTTGKTGMAGGDHLHFSMLINGIFVTPIEWWDPQWIEVTIDAPISELKFD